MGIFYLSGAPNTIYSPLKKQKSKESLLVLRTKRSHRSSCSPHLRFTNFLKLHFESLRVVITTAGLKRTSGLRSVLHSSIQLAKYGKIGLLELRCPIQCTSLCCCAAVCVPVFERMCRSTPRKCDIVRKYSDMSE